MKKNPIKLCLATFALSFAFGQVHAASDGVYPLTENSWSNPDFKKRFLGTYGVNTDINPKVTSDEAEILQGVADLMESNPSQAITTLSEAITPETSAAFEYTIGSLYLQSGEREQAMDMYRKAIDKFPSFFRAYQNLGFALVQDGQFEEAKPMLIEAIEVGGGNGTLFGLLGYCFLNTGDSSLSLDAYRQALLFQPESNDWLLGKLNSLLDLGMNDEAVGMLSDLIEKNPSEANFWMMQANAYMGSQKFDKALANLELVSRMGKASPASLALLGDILLNEGLADLAVERYSDAVSKGGLPVAKMISSAEGLAQRGSISQSLELVSKIESDYAGELSPKNELSLLNLKASGALAQGDNSKASEILEEIVGKDPLNGKALITLGDLYRGEGDTEKAMIQYERASKVKEFEPQALISLARLEVYIKDYKSAIMHLRRANALDPKDYLEDYISRLEAVSKS
ncbi:tetratricopeptide repeat protein [Pelagicoccus albus]|uniref:Tetratricopeptide repeat protein n=1 Tax=Pelagicoccus albus TaxID=415222 RepID=A0A7X1B4E4_9BACT|nr:tetratricopeptide repeat protein [Pelagicoccus albus]MBC2605427.1 tetratricopeptide repeat protein [Pelagicoccus albus]